MSTSSSVYLFFCLPLLLSTSSSFSSIAKLEDLEAWPTYFIFRYLTRVRSSSYSPIAEWIFLRTPSFVLWYLYKMMNSLLKHLSSKTCVLFFTSATRALDSQAHRNMEMTREHANNYNLGSMPGMIIFSAESCVVCVVVLRSW